MPPVTNTPPGVGQERPKIDTTVAHSARVWNYWLGGKDNYAVDRAAGDQAVAMFPDIVPMARGARGFLARAVRYLVRDAGIRQFLDIGTGLPTANNTHEVAQAIAPEARIVYVDNDPLVLVHARALLTSTPEGSCDYIDADVREPDKILAGAAKTLDFTKPVALMMLGILGQIPDSDRPQLIVERLLDAVPSGSYLALADGVSISERGNEAVGRYNENMAYPYHVRSVQQFTGFFDGLEIVEPGLVSVTRWRPDVAPVSGAREVPQWSGVARKP